MKTSTIVILLGIIFAILIFLKRRRSHDRENKRSTKPISNTPTDSLREPSQFSNNRRSHTANESKVTPANAAAFKTNNNGPIFTHIAGIPHKLGKNVQIHSILKVGQSLHAVRDKNNAFDSNAISLHTNALNLGFIPKVDNPSVARHLDTGKQVQVSISNINSHDPWQGVRIKIELM
jgi:hypothetical protein